MKRIEKGICGICEAGCGVEISLESDRITKIRPWKEHIQGVPCTRGLHAPEIVYSSDRLKKPLKRKGPKGTLEFEEISWDQALDEIAGVIFKMKKQYGPQCIASFFGRGNFEESLLKMFTPNERGLAAGNSIFMPLGSSNAFTVGSLCYLSYGMLAPVPTFGLPMMTLLPDLEHADVIFVWGTNPATNAPLNDMIRLTKAKKRGAKIIVIDPIRTEVAKTADLWVPIQPGTDGALIHGILCQLFKQGNVDRTFGEKFCEGFSELEDYVQRFQPEVVREITQVPEKTLLELTDILASQRKTVLLTYTGLEYSNCGVQTIRALLTLWVLTGHLDIVGGQRFQMPFPVPFRKPDVKFPKEIPPIGADRYPFYSRATLGGQFMEFPRSVLQEDPYKIRFMLIGGASILTSFPNTSLFTEAFKALDYLVSIDLFFNADALYADMVLPATTHFEMTSLCSYQNVGTLPFSLQYRKKIIQPMGEARSCYLIYAQLAERLGHGHFYPKTERDMVKYLIEDLPIDFEEFKRRADEGPIPLYEEAFPPYDEKKWLSGKLRRDGEPGFPTPSGKWEISSSGLSNFGHSALPAYEETSEGPHNRKTAKDFPLTLTTGARIRSAFRSQHLNIAGLLKLQPACRALIHADDAGPRNIANGDCIKVTTARGEIRVVAHVTDDIRPGVVEVNQGGGSPIQSEGWRESNVNFLTDDTNRDPISGFPVFKALLCEVEKA
ncbi:MAG: molybdopterin-dependent oxidoreductase [Deltaproteobacteria bacterium]|nr:molybdopterin-dependent oxidoreductase [Deltaproteobacteria bacterium]